MLAKLRAEKPDILIMDAFMPNIDALGVMKYINETQMLKKPMIVVLSGADNPRFEKEILSSGADYYFLKPVDENLLAQRIEQMMEWSKQKAENNLEITVSEILRKMGIPANIKGYRYLRFAIVISVNNPEMMSSMTKALYPCVAKEYRTTPSRVERAMRHAIEVAWNRGDTEILSSYFGYSAQSIMYKPTNSEFIAAVADKLILSTKLS